MFKILGLIAILGSVMAIAVASAAQLPIGDSTVQSGTTGDLNALECDPDGIEINSYMLNDNLFPNTVEGIRIKDVSGDCAGSRMGLRVDDSFGDPIAFSKAGNACYASDNNPAWVVPQAVEPTGPAGGYVFTLTEPDRVTAKSVNATDIYRVEVWVEGSGETSPGGC